MPTSYQGAVKADPGAYNPATVYVATNQVRPSTPNGLWYQLTTAVGAASGEPTWGLIIGGTTVDAAGNVWMCEGDLPMPGISPILTLPAALDDFSPQTFALPLEELADFIAQIQKSAPRNWQSFQTNGTGGFNFSTGGPGTAAPDLLAAPNLNMNFSEPFPDLLYYCTGVAYAPPFTAPGYTLAFSQVNYKQVEIEVYDHTGAQVDLYTTTVTFVIQTFHV